MQLWRGCCCSLAAAGKDALSVGLTVQTSTREIRIQQCCDCKSKTQRPDRHRITDISSSCYVRTTCSGRAMPQTSLDQQCSFVIQAWYSLAILLDFSNANYLRLPNRVSIRSLPRQRRSYENSGSEPQEPTHPRLLYVRTPRVLLRCMIPSESPYNWC